MNRMQQMSRALAVAIGLAVATLPPVMAQEADDGPALGPETGLELPRFVSLRASESNVRRGPSLSHRIDWVFKRRGMPLQIVAEYEHWRRVIDHEGEGGWVHFRMLTGTRTVIVTHEDAVIRRGPNPTAGEVAKFEQGVVAWLGPCNPDWCEISSGGYEGWIPKTHIWGVSPEETRD